MTFYAKTDDPDATPAFLKDIGASYPNVVGAFFDSHWAILPSAMDRMVPVVSQWACDVKLDKEAVAALVEARAKPKTIKQSKGHIGVLPLFGVVAQRMSLIQAISEGGTSTERFGQEFDKMIDDSDVGSVVIQIDSPGGSVFGVQELASKIFDARGSKQIIAVADSLAASAAYWIGTAADQFVVTPGGEVGSIGVLALHVDQSNFNAAAGIKPTYIAVPPAKVDGNPHEPLTDSAHAHIQESVEEYYDAFTADVARFRGVEQSAVKDGFGNGRVVSAKRAKKEGMVDRIATFEQIMDDLTGKSKQKIDKSSAAPEILLSLDAKSARIRRENYRRRLAYRLSRPRPAGSYRRNPCGLAVTRNGPATSNPLQTLDS